MTTASGARPPRIVIAAGGTAGHVVPAIAVADALRAEGAEVTFVGGERAEAELVPAAGYPLDRIAVEGISRSNPLKAARALVKAVGRARHALGGSCAAAGPTPCWAAAATSPARSGSPRALKRIPLVLAEADSHLGLTNRALASRAAPRLPRVPARGPRRRALPRHRPPGPADRHRPPEGAARELGIGPDETVVLVFGGSLGARSINLAAVEGLAGAPYRVLHIAGRRDFAELTAPDERYLLRDYLDAVRHGARRRRPRRRPRRRLDLRARPVRPARGPDPVPARLRRPPDHQRALDGRRRAPPSSSRDAELTPERLRAEVDAIAARPRAAARDERRLARARPPGRGARHRRRGARRRGS